MLADREARQGWQDPSPPEAFELGDHSPTEERPVWPTESLIRSQKRVIPLWALDPNGRSFCLNQGDDRLDRLGSVLLFAVGLVEVITATAPRLGAYDPEGSGTEDSWDAR
jgi:hypothetical protein